MAIARNREILGIIRLKDILKPEIKEKIMAIRSMGIRPVMITGDKPLTAKSIANEVGIDDYVARAKPEDKHDIVLREQADSRISCDDRRRNKRRTSPLQLQMLDWQ